MLRLLCVQLSCGDREGQLSNINFIKSLVTVSTVQYSAVQYSTSVHGVQPRQLTRGHRPQARLEASALMTQISDLYNALSDPAPPLALVTWISSIYCEDIELRGYAVSHHLPTKNIYLV